MKTCRLLRFLAAAFLASGATHPELRAADWPQWRGPNFDGSSPETGLPAQFSRTENVRWTAALPGPAASTPVIMGDRVFLSSTRLDKQTLVALCLDRKSGRLLWEKEIASRVRQDDRSTYASPSPVTDGKIVWFFFGNGDLRAFDIEGREVWGRNIQKDYGTFAFQWTFSSSPILHDERLYLQVLQRNRPVGGRGRTDGPNDSYLLALAPATGKELWRQVRPSEAREESLEAFSTPVPFQHQGRSEILVIGGDCITGHDPKTGTELWRWGTWNPTRIPHWRLVPSPVAGAGVVLACGPKGAPIHALKAGGKGTLEDSSLAWVSGDRELSTDVATPLFYQGRFFVLNGDRKTIAKVDPATGKSDWVGELASQPKIESSPTGADGKIYFMNHRGDVFVVSAGNEFKILHTVAMGDEGDSDLRASIAVAGGNLFIRTGGKLYCIGG